MEGNWCLSFAFPEQRVVRRKMSGRASASEENKDEKRGKLPLWSCPAKQPQGARQHWWKIPWEGSTSTSLQQEHLPVVRGIFCSSQRKLLQVTLQSWFLVPPAGQGGSWLGEGLCSRALPVCWGFPGVKSLSPAQPRGSKG